MRLLFDQSTDRRLGPVLRQRGHDVQIVGVDYPRSLPDYQVLAIARQVGRILVTDDRDFGELVFRHRRAHAGIIFLRLPSDEFAPKLARLLHVINNYADQLSQFVVVTERQVRVRRPPAGSRGGASGRGRG